MIWETITMFVDIELKGGHNLELYTLEPGFEKFLTFEYWINVRIMSFQQGVK